MKKLSLILILSLTTFLSLGQQEGIICSTLGEFDTIQQKIHNALCDDIKGYKEQTVRWAEPDRVNTKTGKYFLPLEKEVLRKTVIMKILKNAEKSRIIEATEELEKSEWQTND